MRWIEKTVLKSYLIDNWNEFTNKERVGGLLRLYLNIEWEDICHMNSFLEKVLQSNDEYDITEFILWTRNDVIGINNSEYGIFGYKAYSLPRNP